MSSTYISKQEYDKLLDENKQQAQEIERLKKQALTEDVVEGIISKMTDKINELGFYDPIKGKLLNKNAILSVLEKTLMQLVKEEDDDPQQRI